MDGNLRGYKVKYRNIAGILEFNYVSVSATQQELLISNLRVFTAYEVAIGAFNEKGRGIWSPLYRWRTGEARKYAFCMTWYLIQYLLLVYQGSCVELLEWFKLSNVEEYELASILILDWIKLEVNKELTILTMKIL